MIFPIVIFTSEFLNGPPPEMLVVYSNMNRSSAHYASKAYANEGGFSHQALCTACNFAAAFSKVIL